MSGTIFKGWGRSATFLKGWGTKYIFLPKRIEYQNMIHKSFHQLDKNRKNTQMLFSYVIFLLELFHIGNGRIHSFTGNEEYLVVYVYITAFPHNH